MARHTLRWVMLAGLFIFPAALIAAPPQSPSINDASANVVSGLLTISGANFGTTAPTVSMDGFVLTLQSFGPSQIVAVLPASVAAAPGSYALTVTRDALGNNGSASFVVTVGAQ